GLHAVIEEVVAVRTGVAIIILLSLVRLVFQTRSWSIALERDGSRTSTGELMLIRLASQGVGDLTVLGPVASEPMKISLLRKHSKSPAAPTLVDTGVYWFTSGLVAIAGCLAAGLLLARNPRAVSTAVILVLAFIAGLFAITRPTLRVSLLGDWL